jgi:hypothetical protein
LCEKRISDIKDNDDASVYCAVDKEDLREGPNAVEVQFITIKDGNIVDSMQIIVTAEPTRVLKIKQDHAFIQVPKNLLFVGTTGLTLISGYALHWFLSKDRTEIIAEGLDNSDDGGGDGAGGRYSRIIQPRAARYSLKTNQALFPAGGYNSPFVRTIDFAEPTDTETRQLYYGLGFQCGYEQSRNLLKQENELAKIHSLQADDIQQEFHQSHMIKQLEGQAVVLRQQQKLIEEQDKHYQLLHKLSAVSESLVSREAVVDANVEYIAAQVQETKVLMERLEARLNDLNRVPSRVPATSAPDDALDHVEQSAHDHSGTRTKYDETATIRSPEYVMCLHSGDADAEVTN